MRIDPRDFYIILLNGEVIAPDNFDIVMNYWTAETVEAFLKAVNPKADVVIQEAQLVDWEPPIDGGNNDK